jgi:hypothetical protein
MQGIVFTYGSLANPAQAGIALDVHFQTSKGSEDFVNIFLRPDTANFAVSQLVGLA